ncbi:MAG: GntR family transcriptional regulator [Planctomycetota bacterium]
MQIQIHDDGTPLYQQVVDQIRMRILSGQFVAGDELPPIRVLAERLRINANTVARAYRELEVAGLVEKRRTRGTFVTGESGRMSTAAKRAAIQPTIDQLVTLSESLGIDSEQLAKWIEVTRNKGKRS